MIKYILNSTKAFVSLTYPTRKPCIWNRIMIYSKMYSNCRKIRVYLYPKTVTDLKSLNPSVIFLQFMHVLGFVFFFDDFLEDIRFLVVGVFLAAPQMVILAIFGK